MRDLPTRWNVWLLGAALALFGWIPSAEAGYFPPSPTAAVSDFSAFLADFNRWDAHLNYQPLLALASTPDPDRMDMALLLWWLWTNGYGRSSGVVGTGEDSLGSFSPPLPPQELSSPDLSSGGFTPPVPPSGGLSPPTPPIGIVSGGPSNTHSDGGDTPPGGGDGLPGSLSHPDITSAPEPSTLTLLGLGSLGLIGHGWRRRKA